MLNVLELAKNTVRIEAEAVANLVDQIDESFRKALELMQKCRGKVIVTGVGKSGIIGKKIAASLSSMGTPAFFVQSAEGAHGDSGQIEAKDVVILISNSGETEEVLVMLGIVQKIGSASIAITSKRDSTLAKGCDVAIVYAYDREADHLNLAPTTSALVTLVIGDALATTLSQMRGFGREDFYRYHPGGSLGRRLSQRGVAGQCS